ncbi:FAD-dependent monooxygenase [Streptomyces sp. NPDC001941]|uniref:FAD-dependent monooxygenase n=1 Tax=Streptomyces sp. NPDC001941 TaxID=3154659 RepID=UPI003333BC21
MNVLIAGAGPTGLTLAIDLARRGVPVRVVDKAAEHFTGSRGDGLQPRTLEVFDDLGVIDTVLAQSLASPLISIHVDGAVVGERHFHTPTGPRPDRPYPDGRMLGQSRTEAILRDKLAEYGVRVELGTELLHFTQDADGVTATLATGEEVRADYLVGADGGHSTVRKALGIPFEGVTDESIRMLAGDVSAKELDHAKGHWFARADNPVEGVLLTPLSGGEQFQFAAPLVHDGVRPDLESLQAVLDAYAGPGAVTLHDLTWVTVWRSNVRLAQRFREGRVFLAGDSAHVHPPTGGQGLNTGVQDAYNLGWRLADGREEVLADYERERRTNALRVLGISTDLLRKHLDGDERALERGEDTRQLDVSYRDPADTSRVTTGDRAPDAPLTAPDGGTLRLFDLFRGPHETLLRFEPTTAARHPHTVDLFRAPGRDGYCAPLAFTYYDAADGTELLVRPDGYLG